MNLSSSKEELDGLTELIISDLEVFFLIKITFVLIVLQLPSSNIVSLF